MDGWANQIPVFLPGNQSTLPWQPSLGTLQQFPSLRLHQRGRVGKLGILQLGIRLSIVTTRRRLVRHGRAHGTGILGSGIRFIRDFGRSIRTGFGTTSRSDSIGRQVRFLVSIGRGLDITGGFGHPVGQGMGRGACHPLGTVWRHHLALSILLVGRVSACHLGMSLRMCWRPEVWIMVHGISLVIGWIALLHGRVSLGVSHMRSHLLVGVSLFVVHSASFCITQLLLLVLSLWLLLLLGIIW